MAEKKQRATSQTTSDITKKEREIFNDNPLIYITFVLKCYSDREHPMQNRDITNKLFEIFPNHILTAIQKAVTNCLRTYFMLKNALNTSASIPCTGEYCADFQMDILATILGGTIEIKNPENRNKQYFFAPLLDRSDSFLIECSIINNPHLNDLEHDFLYQRIKSMINLRDYFQEQTFSTSQDEEIDVLRRSIAFDDELDKTDINDKYKKQLRKTDDDFLNNSYFIRNRNFLNNSLFLYNAIRNKHTICIRYGTFGPKQTAGSSPVSFGLDPAKEDAILNPYALIWNNGHLYLVATHRGLQQPYHYRVDRILNLKLYKEASEDGSKHVVIRESIPNSLDCYFDDTYTIFNQTKYLSTHPLMGAYKADDPILPRCMLRTTKNGIGTLFDHFGNNLKIDTLTEQDTEINLLTGQPQRLYDVTINHVQHANLLLLCLHHHDQFTLIEPKDMRQEIKEQLQLSIQKLDTF